MNHFPLLPSDRHFRITHDPKLRVAYVYLVDRRVSGGSHRSVQALDGSVIIDLDKADRVVGIEFLDTRRLHPETLAEAEKPAPEPEDFLDEKDRQVLAACLGDRHAQQVLCLEHHEGLVRDACEVLGKHRKPDAEDVVAGMWERLVAGEYRPPMIRGAGVVWLRRLVKSAAAEIVRRGGAR
ncbi:MAG TPA: DUF2283 domain-containing protein [Polyangiaceae bacterium]